MCCQEKNNVDNQKYSRKNNEIKTESLFNGIDYLRKHSPIDVAAAVVYCWHGDFKHTIYWFATATLTATVTF